MAAQGTIELQDLNGNPITPSMIQGGQQILAILTPPDGYEFDRWVDNSGETITTGIERMEDENTFKITVECGTVYKAIFKNLSDDTCSVLWAMNLDNDISINNPCVNCGEVTISTYDCNGQATIEATPNCCYEFEKWQNDNSTENPRTVGVSVGSHITYTAVVKERVYTISVMSNDSAMGSLTIGDKEGSNLDTTPYKVRCGEQFMLKATPNKGYYFEGWSDLPDTDPDYATPERVVEFDCNLNYSLFNKSRLEIHRANFKETEKYRIRYHSGTGEGVPSDDPSLYSVGDIFTTWPSNTFGYAYHTFMGWKFDTPASATYAGSTQIELTSAIAALADNNNIIHMYAQWSEAQRVAIKYDLNGGDGEVPEEQEAPIGDMVILNDGTGITKEGENLMGWSTESDGGGTTYPLGGKFTMPASDITLYASWSPYYSVKYSPNGGEGVGIVDDNGGEGYQSGAMVIVFSNSVTNYRWANHTFKGWNTKSDGSGTSYDGGGKFNIQNDTTLYAMWLADETSTLTLYNADGTTSLYSYTGYVGNQVTLAYVPTLSHYVFKGWSTQIGGSLDYSAYDRYTLVSGGSALYALWTAAPTYKVTYDGNGATSGSVSDSSTYYAGDTVTVLGKGNLVKGGNPYPCTFSGWYTNAQGSGTAYQEGGTFTIARDTVLYAKWSCCPVTFVTSPNGSITVNGTTVPQQSSSTLNYENKNQITVTVYPANGYTFLGWVDAATNEYITPDGTGCASSMPASVRYAYVPIDRPTEGGEYTNVDYVEPQYTTKEFYENKTIVCNETYGQYYQAIDLSLVGCPVEMLCGGTYIAMFVPCSYGKLDLCNDCYDGYEYVESDPIYVYEQLDEPLSTSATSWRAEDYFPPDPVTATSPMYFAKILSDSPLTYEYYEKVYSNNAYSYVQLTGTDAEDRYLAAPVAGEYTPDYVYDFDASEYYYKIKYDGEDVTNVTKAYTSLPTEYLGDIIAWYEVVQTQSGDNENEYYNSGGVASSYNRYYEWSTTTNGYVLIPASHSYEYRNSTGEMDTVFLQTKYLNHEYIKVNSSPSGQNDKIYRWNGSMYVVDSTVTPTYTFNSVGEFIMSYLRYDISNNSTQITACFLKNLDAVGETSVVRAVRWTNSGYMVTSIIPVFKYESGYTSTDYLDELNCLFPINSYGIHDTSSTSEWLHRFGDTLDFNTNRFEWNVIGKAYAVNNNISIANAHAHVYSSTPTKVSEALDTFIGTYIIYNGSLMRLRYCHGAMCSYNLYYESVSDVTIARNNIIGNSAATAGLYVTEYSTDTGQAPTAITVSESNFMEQNYGTPSSNDPDNILVVSTYYIGGKSPSSSEVVFSVEYPCLKMEATYNAYNNIPSWRARTGLTDGNPTENMYVFPGTVVDEYFIKHLKYKMFTKECQSA